MSRHRKNIVCNRILKMLFISSILFFILILRLYYIQITQHSELKAQVLKQRGEEISLYPDRGIIYDRNLIPLTNREIIPTAFVYKDNLLEDKELMNFIIENSEFDEKQLKEYIKDKNSIVAIPLNWEIESPDRSKMFIANRIVRYGKNNILTHVIGYINKAENRGEAGIEKVYDEILKDGEKHFLYLEVDRGKNKTLNGEYMVSQDKNIMDPKAVKLTVDYHIQKIVEEVLDEKGIQGAVIVAHVESGEIRAMASRPNFSQYEIDEYLKREDMALYNKAIQVANPPGSLFKTVVLLAALEKDTSYLNKTFYCNGYEQINNVTIKCNEGRGHGYIGLKDAFSKSCNSTFIQLGQEIGSESIIHMAERLGMGERINIGLVEEVKGNLPKGKELKGPAIGNISIGQGSIEITPLQITNMMLIIANKGIRKDMTIVDGITTKDGYMIKEFKRNDDERIISQDIAEIVQDFMIEVVLEGTAKNMDLDFVGGAGGKTGSAQAVFKGKETIHGWFSGFYPAKNPNYVITVFVEGGFSGSGAAVPIFEDIAKRIHQINR